MELSRKERKNLYKNSMSMEEVIDKLKNITSPVLLEVISIDDEDIDRTRVFYPNSYIEYNLEYSENYYTSCFLELSFLENFNDCDLLTEEKYKLDDYSTAKHKVNRMLVISEMLRYDYLNDLRIINIIET